MKNKLLLSTALVGGLALTGVAHAQTTITGNMNLSYKSATNDNGINNTNVTAGNRTNATDSSFGRETQINVQNKGKLNNGIDYAAGFSLEFDGLSGAVSNTSTSSAASDSRITRIANENVFIDLIFGTTTLSVGSDHLNNMSFSAVPRVAQHMGTTLASVAMDTSSSQGVSQAATVGGGTAYRFYAGGASLGSSNYMGLGVQQVTPFGTITGQYFPRANATAASNDGIVRQTSNDAYELHYRGNLGVKGLTATAGYNLIKQNGATTAAGGADDQTGAAVGLGYNFGSAAVGIQKNWTDNGGAAATQVDISSVEIGATYALTKDITLGATRVTTSGQYFTAVDMPSNEKATSLTVGYNLGAVNTSVTYAQVKDIRGVHGVDSDIFLARAAVNF
jgi:hypothetical protein